MEDEKKKYIDCLLADFSSIKEEIRRRATLQRFVLIGFATILALTFKEMGSNTLTSSWIAALWVGSFLALLFYCREDLEIKRLGTIIKGRIAVLAARELDVEQTNIFHSETNQGVGPIDISTKIKYSLFLWIVFFCLPGIFTLIFIEKHILRILSTYTPGDLLSFLAVILAVDAVTIGCISLLWRHLNPKRRRGSG